MDHGLKEHMFDLMLMVMEGERDRACEMIEKIVDMSGLEGLHEIILRMAHTFAVCVLNIQAPSSDTEVEMTPVEPTAPEVTWAADVIAAYASDNQLKLEALITEGIDAQNANGRVERLGHLIRLAVAGYRGRDGGGGEPDQTPAHTLN